MSTEPDPDFDPLQDAASSDDINERLKSDDALALQFTGLHGDVLRFVALWGKWLQWDGTRWRKEETLYAYDLARIMLRQSRAEKSAGKVAAIVRLASMDRAHARLPENFDAQDWYLNTPAGTVDLRTGQSHPHSQEDGLTKITPVAPGGDCPLWQECLKTWTDGDDELIAYLQRLVGYWLSGSVREETLSFFYGVGANGKTKFIEAVRYVMGEDYVTGIALETLMRTRGDQHPTDMAGLFGKRLAVAMETERGRQFAEAKIKALTGGDMIHARYMRQDYWDFRPTHKLAIVGNHKPSVSFVDESIMRRIHIVPFEVIIPKAKRDRDLLEKLKEQAGAILQWAIDGACEWFHDPLGLNPPGRVLHASQEYFEEQDSFEEWWDTNLVIHPQALVSKRDLFDDWMRWCEARHELMEENISEFRTRIIGKVKKLEEEEGYSELFAKSHKVKGVDEGKRNNQKVWKGLGLRSFEAQ